MGAPIGNRNAAGPRGYSEARNKRNKIAYMKSRGTYKTPRQRANARKITAYQRSIYNKSRRLK